MKKNMEILNKIIDLSKEKPLISIILLLIVAIIIVVKSKNVSQKIGNHSNNNIQVGRDYKKGDKEC